MCVCAVSLCVCAVGFSFNPDLLSDIRGQSLEPSSPQDFPLLSHDSSVFLMCFWIWMTCSILECTSLIPSGDLKSPVKMAIYVSLLIKGVFQ